jgi:hypothetical protein
MLRGIARRKKRAPISADRSRNSSAVEVDPRWGEAKTTSPETSPTPVHRHPP